LAARAPSEMADEVAGAPAGSLASSLSALDAQVRATAGVALGFAAALDRAAADEGPAGAADSLDRAHAALSRTLQRAALFAAAVPAGDAAAHSGAASRVSSLDSLERAVDHARTAALEFGLEMAAPACAAEEVQPSASEEPRARRVDASIAERGARPPPAAAAEVRPRAPVRPRSAAPAAARPASAFERFGKASWEIMRIGDAREGREHAPSSFKALTPQERQRCRSFLGAGDGSEAGIAKAGAASELSREATATIVEAQMSQKSPALLLLMKQKGR
jgi:hypothetical protein